MKCQRNGCCEFYEKDNELCQDNKKAWDKCPVWKSIDKELEGTIIGG